MYEAWWISMGLKKPNLEDSNACIGHGGKIQTKS
jgi:hypothetical protein